MRSKLVSLAAILTLITAACGGDSATTTSIVLDTDTTSGPEPVGQDVGPDGGTVTSDDGMFTVEIPPGALSETTSIAIEPIPASTLGLDGGLFAGSVYQLLPDGLSFDVPVATIRTVRASDLGTPDDEVPFFYVLQGVGEAWELLSTNSSRDGDLITVVAETTHFTPNIIVETTLVLDREVTATLAPASFTEVVGGFRITATTLRAAAEHEGGEHKRGLKRSGAIIAYAKLDANAFDEATAVCGDQPGEGTYTVTFAGTLGRVGANAIIIWLKNALQEVVDPEGFTISATGNATCTKRDTSIGDSLVGASTGTLSFQPFEGGPPGVAYDADFDILILTDDGVFTVEKTQKPSNQKTEGALDPTSGGYFTIGGTPDVNFEAYVGVMCPLPDGSYWLYGFTFGGPPALQDDLGDILDSTFIFDIDAALPGSVDGRVAHDLGLTRECNLGVEEAIDRALRLMRENARLADFDYGWFHRYAGRAEPSR